MKLTKSQSKKLRKKLPKGWSTAIKERLETKGSTFTVRTIQSVVYGEYYSSLILEEAILLKQEEQERIENLKKSI